ncbi:MAG: glycoside hydrolase family 97 catalytic domain-containing protein [Solirubrobacteraceae bacterium]
MPAAEVPPPAYVVADPSGTRQAALERRSGRFVLTLRGGIEADLGPAPDGRLRADRGRYAARFTTPSGKRRVHRLTGRTLTVAGVEVLATEDGVAWRTRGADAVVRAPRTTQAWLQRYTGAYEEPYRGGRLAGRARGRYAFPLLLRDRGRYTLLTEAGVARAAVSHTRLAADGLHVQIARGESAPRRTPWRVAVTGGLDRVVESDLPLALGRQSKVRDTSWIEPGVAAWSWLSDHSSPERLETQKEYVDLAVAQGWEYVTVDEGWRPGFIRELIAYARARGVKVILWFDKDDVTARVLDRVKRWGAAGIKADFFYSDSEEQIRAMDDIARQAAARRLVVAFHGNTVPRGLQRTWPNVLTVEAVRGAEYGDTTARDEVNLAFTRNPVGGMDFTPAGTGARELAQAVVFESGLQHLGGAAGIYADADRILRELPAAWDDTRLLTGAPDRHAVIGRRDGRRWFVGGLTAGPLRTLEVRLPAGRWAIHLVGEDGSRDFEATGTISTRGDFAAILTPAS